MVLGKKKRRLEERVEELEGRVAVLHQTVRSAGAVLTLPPSGTGTGASSSPSHPG